MNRYSNRTLFTIAGLSVGSIVISSISIAQIKRLYLPLPLAIAVINLIIPIIALLSILIPSRIVKSKVTPILAAAASASTFIPFVLLILSFVYGVPSDLLSCTSERRWLQFFRNHDDAIRLIQDRLQCCGFNSLHDRAWPFPSHDTTARACELTRHYGIRCADVWLQQESNVAGMTGFASFLNWILLVFLLSSRTNSIWVGYGSIGTTQQRLLGGPEPAQHNDRIANEATYEDEPRNRL